MRYRRQRTQRRVFIFVLIAFAVGAFPVVLSDRNEPAAEQPSTMEASPSPMAVAVVTPHPPADPGLQRTIRRVYGSGASAVAVVRPAGHAGALPVVLFLHGWGYQQRGAYAAWIRHLARTGNAVIIPRYQVDAGSDPAGVRAAMVRGVLTGLSRISARPRTLVVAGHSAGAALAADYAVIAPSHGLPRPRAIFAVFPGRAIIGTPGIPPADPGRIAGDTRLVAMAGARDTVVGQDPARQLVAAAKSIPDSRRRFVLVSRPSVSDHLAPLRATRAARRTFWRALDRLIAAARA